MVKMIVVVWITLCVVIVVPSQSRGQTQSPADMQAQENAADSQTSASGTATYTTPYKLYQKFYIAFSGTSPSTMFSYFTQDGLKNWCRIGELSYPLTSEQLGAMDAGRVKQDEQDYALASFKFTADPKSPKITIIVTYTRKDPESTNRLNFTETEELTLSDTPMGWMISTWNSN